MARPRDAEASVPASARPAHDAVVALTDALCRQYLDDEYRVLCRRLAGVLARKRPSPLAKGKPEGWACALVRVIDWVNPLDGRNPAPHRAPAAIGEALGVPHATARAKAKAIRDLLRIRPLDPRWALPGRRRQAPPGGGREGPAGERVRGGEGVPGAMSRSASADTACLVGEFHLRKGEYEKAVEAFSRAIEGRPTGDAYQGRAKAYRALAAHDEAKAAGPASLASGEAGQRHPEEE